MIDIPEIVRRYILINCKRMPETQKEVDDYLDLINHGKEYAQSFQISQLLGVKGMKRLGFKTPSEIKKEGKKLFKPTNMNNNNDTARINDAAEKYADNNYTVYEDEEDDKKIIKETFIAAIKYWEEQLQPNKQVGAGVSFSEDEIENVDVGVIEIVSALEWVIDEGYRRGSGEIYERCKSALDIYNQALQQKSY